MGTTRTGAMGVGTTKGDLYVVDENLDLERVPIGTDEQVLLSDSAAALGVRWGNITELSRASMQMDQTDAIFRRIDIGGLIALPQATRRGSHAVISYDDTVIQGLAWQRYVDAVYNNGGAWTLSLYWVADTAIVGDVVWAAAFERDNAGVDITADAFIAFQTAAASTAPGTAGAIAVATIPFTSAEADAIANGEPFRIFIQRTADAVGDDMVGDAQLLRAVLAENA